MFGASRVDKAEPSPSPYRFAVRAALVLFAVIAAGAGLVYLAFVPPMESAFYPKCQLHSVTGLHCPGCGTTRAMHAALNGRVIQSLAYNASPLLAFPLVGIILARMMRKRNRNDAANSNVWPWVIGATLLLYGILRNLPWHPFTLLAPHEIGA
jgi:hypothetical protein